MLTQANTGTDTGPRTGRNTRVHVPIRRAVVAVVLSCALLLTTAACGNSGTSGNAGSGRQNVADTIKVAATSPAEKQKFAKTRFVANAGLAAGATYQWIIKPYKKGKFKKGAHGRKLALVKAGLAGAFAYNRLKAATKNAKGDPLLSKAVAPLTAGIDSLKDLGKKLRKGDAGSADVSSFEKVIKNVKKAGSSVGAPVKDKVPSLSQLKE